MQHLQHPSCTCLMCTAHTSVSRKYPTFHVPAVALPVTLLPLHPFPSHNAHAPLPAAALYVPAAHAVQVTPPSLLVYPASQVLGEYYRRTITHICITSGTCMMQHYYHYSVVVGGGVGGMCICDGRLAAIELATILAEHYSNLHLITYTHT
jgi:hypothetical protein